MWKRNWIAENMYAFAFRLTQQFFFFVPVTFRRHRRPNGTLYWSKYSHNIGDTGLHLWGTVLHSYTTQLESEFYCVVQSSGFVYVRLNALFLAFINSYVYSGTCFLQIFLLTILSGLFFYLISFCSVGLVPWLAALDRTSFLAFIFNLKSVCHYFCFAKIKIC